MTPCTAGHAITRDPSGPLRQVLIADQRSVEAGTLVCDLSMPLKQIAPEPARKAVVSPI
ncbi:MAG: hypothetical protein ACRDVP_12330 [Acidimicrobiales bacterium]